MGLYKNIIQWIWNLEERPGLPTEVGEFISFINYPFFEYNLDPIFKIVRRYADCTADIEVVQSNKIPLGTLYEKQYLGGFRRVKLSSIEEITSEAHSPDEIDPQPTPIKILKYEKKHE